MEGTRFIGYAVVTTDQKDKPVSLLVHRNKAAAIAAVALALAGTVYTVKPSGTVHSTRTDERRMPVQDRSYMVGNQRVRVQKVLVRIEGDKPYVSDPAKPLEVIKAEVAIA